MQWEYKVYNHETLKGEFIRTFNFDPVKLQEALDAHGREGWELVSITSISMHDGHSDSLLATFKRPITPLRVSRKTDSHDEA